MRREDLFTVVHELFMTDTAVLADIVLPATSQLEHTDLHKAYGHTTLTYNHPALPPLGECQSNWDVMQRLATEMGFSEPWLHQAADEVLDEVLTATAAKNPALAGITLDRLKQENTVPLTIEPDVPFADFYFPTPSGKVELYSQTMADMGLDPLPGWQAELDSGGQDGRGAERPFPSPTKPLPSSPPPRTTLSPAPLPTRTALVAREGEPFVEIHPDDAARHHIQTGDWVRLENGRGFCDLQARVTDGVRPGVVASPKGRWGRMGNGRNINWLTSDALADMAGQSTFHSSRVWLRRLD
jgi:anaerobic selenocysteine-containing dehydrogenase